MKRSFRHLVMAIAAIASAGTAVDRANAEFVNYHVGRDGLATLTSGTYVGLANPNYQRLTLLRFNDLEVADPASSHWHAIGAYSYTGPAGSPTVQSTNANNRIPEGFTGHAPLNLSPGSGPFAGKLVSGIPDSSPQSHDHYDQLTMKSVQELASAPADSLESYLYNSSAGRWNQPLTQVVRPALKLIGHTPGLAVAGTDGAPLLTNDNDVFELGQGDDWTFTPVFWVDGSASSGTYSAAMQLVDLSGTLAESGLFHIDFRVIPEPATGAMGALGAFTLAAARRRRPC